MEVLKMIVHNIIPLNFDEKLRKTKKNEEKRRKTKKNGEELRKTDKIFEISILKS